MADAGDFVPGPWRSFRLLKAPQQLELDLAVNRVCSSNGQDQQDHDLQEHERNLGDRSKTKIHILSNRFTLI